MCVRQIVPGEQWRSECVSQRLQLHVLLSLILICAAFLYFSASWFILLWSGCSAHERCVDACRRRGSERVNADSVTVLSVRNGAVPAHRLLLLLLLHSVPPETRPGEPGLVCVAVSHSGRTRSQENQPALRPETCCCCRLSGTESIEFPCRSFSFKPDLFILHGAPRVADPTGGDERRAAGRHDTEHGRSDLNVRLCSPVTSEERKPPRRVILVVSRLDCVQK